MQRTGKEQSMNTFFFGRGRGIMIAVIMAGIVFTGSPPLCFSEEESFQELPGNSEVVQDKDGQKRISLDFQDVALKQILKIFSQQAGMNFVASENVQDKKVTLFMDKVTIEDALNSILGANGFILEKQEGTNIYMVKDSGVSNIALQTKIYKLSYATVSGAGVGEEDSSQGIEIIMQNLLSPNGKLVIDSRTNSLLITDTPAALKQIEDVLKELDVKTQQVLISAEIMEVSVDTLKRIGIEWGSSTGQLMSYGAGTRSTYWPFKEGLFKDVTKTATIGSVDFSSFAAVLQAIKTDANTNYLARPRLLTLNNRTAEMKITKNAAVATTTVTISEGGSPQTTTALERYEVGTTLKVTPHINKDDYVTLTIEPEISRVRASAFGSGNYDPLTRSSKSSIMVKDGETIVIAGLISREDSDSNRKTPFLGEIPIVGKMFDRDEKQRSDTEILVFITTQIIKDSDSALLTAMQHELGLNSMMGSGQANVASPKMLSGFHTLVREQDSPLSAKELIIDSEMIKMQAKPSV